MIGAIAGDIIGSVYEFDNIKTTVFPLFTRKSNYTDDTIMTVAVTDCYCMEGISCKLCIVMAGSFRV